jgi:hypothetical protein
LRIGSIWLLTAASMACAPEVSVPEWDPIDMNELERQLAEPTGELADVEDVEQWLEALGAKVATVRSAGDALDVVKDVLESGEGPPPVPEGSDGRAPSGTSVYLKIACPGEDPEDPDLSFDSGMIRVDSPRLSEEVLENLHVQGDLLFTFVECVAIDVSFDGEVRAFYEKGDSPRLALDPELEAEELLTGAVQRFTGVALLETDWVQFAYTPEPDQTITVGFVPGLTDVVEVKAADGTYECDLLTLEPCVPIDP